MTESEFGNHNAKLVLDFLEQVTVGRIPDAVDHFVAEDFRDHCHPIAPGRTGLRQYLIRESAVVAGEDRRTRAYEPEFVVTEHDLVTTCFYFPQPDPQDPATDYDYFAFDTYRVRDGVLVEHWSNFNRAAPVRLHRPDTAARHAVVPTPSSDSRAVESNKQLVDNFYRDVFGTMNAGAVKDYAAVDYHQHAAWRAAPGRAGLEDFVRGIAANLPPGIRLPQPPTPDIMMGEGDLVVCAASRQQSDPANPGATYPYYIYDAYRVHGGKLTDHWSGIDKAAQP